jgi:hypothetical protein
MTQDCKAVLHEIRPTWLLHSWGESDDVLYVTISLEVVLTVVGVVR